MLKKRGIKAIIITLLIALSTSCFSLMFVNVLSVFSQPLNEQPPAKAADLEIRTKEQLINFANAVNGGDSYDDKLVVLCNNINCSMSEIPCVGGGKRTTSGTGNKYEFNGTFDGQGFCIYNFKLIGGYTYSTNKIVGQKLYDYYHDYYLGLFVNLGSSAVVKNLKVSDYEYKYTKEADHKTRPTYHRTHINGLVSNRTAQGIVSECWTPEIVSKVGTIKNIMVGDNSRIINGSGEVFDSKESVTGLDLSYEGGSSGKIWYQNEHYNDGWPCLRVFIKTWRTYKFNTNLNFDYDESKTFIYPSVVSMNNQILDMNGASAISDLKYDSDGYGYYEYYAMPLVFYGGVVQFEEPAGYDFSHWTYFDVFTENIYRFTARYVLEPFNITFSTLAGATTSGTGTYSINNSKNINVSATAYKITYTFIDTGGTSRTITYEITDTNGEYYFDPSEYSNLNGNDLYSNSELRTICPVKHSKTFGVEFK